MMKILTCLLAIVIFSCTAVFSEESSDVAPSGISLSTAIAEVALSTQPAAEIASPVEPIADSELSDFEVYIARGGDTLYSIAARYYGDDSGWERIQRYNRFVRNPKKLRPGLEIIVPLPQKPQPKVKLDVAGAMQDIVLAEGKKQQVEKDRFMIVPGDFKFDGFIVGQKADRTMISASDIVYIDLGVRQGVVEGDRYNVYRSGREIEHPDTGEIMGTVVEKIGQLEVIGGIEQASSAASIISSYEPISIGDVIRKVR